MSKPDTLRFYPIHPGPRDHEADRRFLRWLRIAPLSELRAMTAAQARAACPSWEVTALNRELRRRLACVE